MYNKPHTHVQQQTPASTVSRTRRNKSPITINRDRGRVVVDAVAVHEEEFFPIKVPLRDPHPKPEHGLGPGLAEAQHNSEKVPYLCFAIHYSLYH
jgi:hypothetical protein